MTGTRTNTLTAPELEPGAQDHSDTQQKAEGVWSGPDFMALLTTEFSAYNHHSSAKFLH